MDLPCSHSDVFDTVSVHSVGLVADRSNRSTALLTGSMELRNLVYEGKG